MTRSFIPLSAIAATLLILISARLPAQHSHTHSDTIPSRGSKSGIAEDWKMTAMTKHMAYSSPRPLTAPDSVRAAHVINELRQAIAKYQDVKVAEADGYKMFAPQIKNQPQYHFTKGWNAIHNQPLGVATREECDAAGGRFIPQAFEWMVHATTFAGNDLQSIWHDDHMAHDHAMLGDRRTPTSSVSCGSRSSVEAHWLGARNFSRPVR